MKFRYKLPIPIIVGFCALIVAELVTVCYFLCKIFGLFNLTSNSLPMEISTTIVCVLAMVFSIFMLTLHYRVTATHLQLKLGFFDLLNKRVAISKILNVVHKKEEKLTYISYVTTALDPIIMLVAVEDSKSESFAKTLQTINAKIIYTEE